MRRHFMAIELPISSSLLKRTAFEIESTSVGLKIRKNEENFNPIFAEHSSISYTDIHSFVMYLLFIHF